MGSPPRKRIKYKRILLKLSGEALIGQKRYGIDSNTLDRIAREILELHKLGIQVALVVGAGNIFRGVAGSVRGMDRVSGDYMGMLATIINALAIQDSIEKLGLETRVLTAVEVSAVAEPFIRRRAIRHLEKDRVIILAGGTGNPFFTTDTAAALRAMEIRADVFMKATKVDGIYTKDPMKSPQAKIFKEISYLDVLKKRLKVMDSTAISLCMENRLPIIIFNIKKRGQIKKLVMGTKIGSMIKG